MFFGIAELVKLFKKPICPLKIFSVYSSLAKMPQVLMSQLIFFKILFTYF